MDFEGLAEEHADWYSETFAKFVRRVYKDAFIHGYKHGIKKD